MRVSDDGFVVGEIRVEASVQQVQALISDPQQHAALTPDIQSVNATPVGACAHIDMHTEGVGPALQMLVKRCPTANGWTDRLVSSEDFNFYEAEIKAEEGSGFTLVTYRIRSVPDLPVPEWMVVRATRESVGQLLVNLRDRL